MLSFRIDFCIVPKKFPTWWGWKRWMKLNEKKIRYIVR